MKTILFIAIILLLMLWVVLRPAAAQMQVEGRIPPGTFCYASVQTDTVVCKRMKDIK